MNEQKMRDECVLHGFTDIHHFANVRLLVKKELRKKGINYDKTAPLSELAKLL